MWKRRGTTDIPLEGRPSGPAQRLVGREGSNGERMSTRARVRLATIVVGGLAVVLHVVWGESLNAAPSTDGLPWWLIAAFFYVAEVLVVHVGIGRDGQGFSLNEIPLVVGLFFLSPVDLVLAQTIGTGAGSIVKGRQGPQDLAFTLAYRSLGATVAGLAFHTLAVGAGPLRPPAWGAAAAAALLATAIGWIAATYLQTLRGVTPAIGGVEIVGLGMLSILANTTVGLAEATLLWVSPNSAWLAAGLTGMLYLAYRAYWAERRKHESVELLYETSKILQQPGDLEGVVLGLLKHLRKLFRADSAQLLLCSTSEDGAALSTFLGPTGEREIMRRVELPLQHFPSGEPGSGSEVKLVSSANAAEYRRRLPVRFSNDALVVGLRSEERRVGILVIGDRGGEVSTFDREAQKLLSALAGHVTAALENGRLERSLARLTQLEQQLRHQAFHDPLTGLANRVLFHERVQHALDRRGARSAVLFVDLDGFKEVNDAHGHAAGDRVLIAAADRMRTCLRPGDTAARLSGDEFAILLEDIADTETACRVGARVVEMFGVPFSVGHDEVMVGASCGIAVSEGHGRADVLLANADKAMYKVKSEGKGRYTLYEPVMQWEAL
jgi:diguanylate cyclase (GGDEF)-like protein